MEMTQEVFMIALIPGITSALTSLQPQPAASPAPQDGFPRLLDSASQSLQSGESPAPPAPPRYQVQPGDSLTAIAKKLGYDNPQALAQTNHLQNPDQLQVGQVLTLPENTPGPRVAASTPLAKRADKISAGRSQAADTVAHKSLPLGTRLTLTNPQNGSAVRVQVTDRGPYVSGRSLDLSYSAAQKLGVIKNGVSKVWMEGG
jgi:LysM repeat protein